MGVVYALDTNAVLYYLGNRLAEPIPKSPIVVSILTEIELLSYPRISESEETDIREFLSDIRIVALTPPIKEMAIRIRRASAIRIPDSIIAATAIVLDAVLITYDQKVLRLPDIQTWQPALRS